MISKELGHMILNDCIIMIQCRQADWTVFSPLAAHKGSKQTIKAVCPATHTTLLTGGKISAAKTED